MPTRVTQNRGGCCRHFFSFSCGVSICTKRFILAYKLRFSERDKSIREKITKHLISAKILNSESNPSYYNIQITLRISGLRLLRKYSAFFETISFFVTEGHSVCAGLPTIYFRMIFQLHIIQNRLPKEVNINPK